MAKKDKGRGITAWIPEDQYAAVTLAASLSGENVSNFARLATLEIARDVLSEQGVQERLTKAVSSLEDLGEEESSEE